MSNGLSVVIPVYNTESYLRECLDSIINQTYTNLEIIVVNDVTPDNSEQIILEYQQKDPRIKYIKHPQNLGLGGARNTGISNATKEWIAFIDSDDYLDLHCYQNMMNLIEQNPKVNLGIFAVQLFHDTTNEIIIDPFFDAPNLGKDTFYIAPMACNKIFKKSDIINNNITFPNHLKHEDEAFWMKYIAVTNINYISDNTQYYKYRQRENSIMANKNNSRVDLPYILLDIYKFYEQHHLTSLRDRIIQLINHYTNSHVIMNFNKAQRAKFYRRLKEVFTQIPLSQNEINQLPFVMRKFYTLPENKFSQITFSFFLYYDRIKRKIPSRLLRIVHAILRKIRNLLHK